MKRAVQIVVLTVLLAACSWAVTVGLLPPPMASFTDANGLPLAGGLICTYAAGTSTPLATYTDSTGTVANANPVILNASGRANIWLATNTPYKITIRTSGGNCAGTGPGGVLVTSTDNVSGVPPAVPILWSSSGTTMSNLYGYKVCISATSCTSSLALLNIQGTSVGGVGLLRIDDAGGTPGVDLYGASGVALGSYGADSAGLRLRTPGGISQMVVGSSGITVQNMSVAGATSVTVQAGVAQGSTNLLRFKDSAGTEVSYVTPTGIFLAPRYNASAAAGAYTFSNSNQLFLVNGYGDVTANGQLHIGGVNDDAQELGTSNAAIRIAGTTVIDNARNATFATLTCTGTPCGSGGGGGGSPSGVTGSLQTYATASTLGGDANFTYITGTGIVSLLGSGYISSHGGFVTNGTATNVIQAPNGGILGATLRTTDSVIWVEEAEPSVSASSQARMYMDSTLHAVKLSQQGGAYAQLATRTGTLTNGNCVSIDSAGNFIDAGGACTTGGGGGTVASATGNQVAYYTTAGAGTTVGGSSSFTWNNSTKQMAVASTGTSVAALTVTSGYVASAGGFNSSSSAVDSIQAPTGGVTAKWLYTSDSLIFTEEAQPALSATGQARLYFDTASQNLRASLGGGAYSTIGVGGGVSSITGTPNRITANTPSGAVTLNLPQDIHAGATPTFAAVIANGAFNSTVTGSSIAFKTASNNFTVDGNGNISGTGSINMTGTGYKVSGTTVIDGSRNATVQNLTISGTCTGCSSAGVSSVTGSFGMVGVNNDFSGAAKSGVVNFTLPQRIDQAYTPTFAAVIANGKFNSTVTNYDIAFQTSSSTFSVNGAGAVTSNDFFNATLGYKVGGFQVIDSSRRFIGYSVDVGAGTLTAYGLNWYGGSTVIDSARNATFNSVYSGTNIFAAGSIIAAGAMVTATGFSSGGSVGLTGTVVFPSAFTFNGTSYTKLFFNGGILIATQ